MSNQEILEGFESQLLGLVFQPEDEGYEEARSIWNAMIDKRPVAIVQCSGVADVIKCVNFARDHELPLAIRGGGHNVAGNAICDDGLVIDLSRMKGIRVDPENKTARAEGGVTWREFDHETQAFGLAVPSGVVSTTGVAGLTLGGGFGRLSRKYGLTADNLISADVVTADGELITASKSENADLFWGLRGGSGNFGVVTSFEFQLHEVGPDVLFGPIVYRYEDAAGVLQNYREFALNVTNECCIWLDILSAPPLPFLPEEIHGETVVFVAPFFVGDIEKGKEVLAPLREFGDPIADAVASTSYKFVQQALDDLYGEGMRNYWKSHNYKELPDGVIDVIVEYGQTLPTEHSDILISHVGGAINDVASNATAYPHRDIEFIITPGSRWQDPDKDEEYIGWLQNCHKALDKYSSGGAYVNFISEREGNVRDAYSINYDRLTKLKAKYDPDNLFHINQNITPED